MSRDDRRCYVGRCPKGCILSASILPTDAQDSRVSAAEFLADAVLSGLTVSLESFDDAKAEPHFFRCQDGHTYSEGYCGVNILPDEAEVRVSWNGSEFVGGDVTLVDDVVTTPNPIPHEAARVIRSFVDGDGVFDRGDVRRVLGELEHEGFL